MKSDRGFSRKAEIKSIILSALAQYKAKANRILFININVAKACALDSPNLQLKLEAIYFVGKLCKPLTVFIIHSLPTFTINH